MELILFTCYLLRPFLKLFLGVPTKKNLIKIFFRRTAIENKLISNFRNKNHKKIVILFSSLWQEIKLTCRLHPIQGTWSSWNWMYRSHLYGLLVCRASPLLCVAYLPVSRPLPLDRSPLSQYILLDLGILISKTDQQSVNKQKSHKVIRLMLFIKLKTHFNAFAI